MSRHSKGLGTGMVTVTVDEKRKKNAKNGRSEKETISSGFTSVRLYIGIIIVIVLSTRRGEDIRLYIGRRHGIYSARAFSPNIPVGPSGHRSTNMSRR